MCCSGGGGGGIGQTIECWIIDLSRFNVPIEWAFSERSFPSDFPFLRPKRYYTPN